MTVGELARRAGRSVEDLVASAFSNGAGSQPRAVTAVAKPEGAVARGGLELDAVLAALASVGGPAKLEEVRAKVGGSTAQVRAALQKLAGARKLTITGERRGTRYSAR